MQDKDAPPGQGGERVEARGETSEAGEAPRGGLSGHNGGEGALPLERLDRGDDSRRGGVRGVGVPGRVSKGVALGSPKEGLSGSVGKTLSRGEASGVAGTGGGGALARMPNRERPG